MRSPRPLLTATEILGLVDTLAPVGARAGQSIAQAWTSAAARTSVRRRGPRLWIMHAVPAPRDREQSWALRAGDSARLHRDGSGRTRGTTPLLSDLTTSQTGSAPTAPHR